MIKAIALDDEKPALNIIENFCGKLDMIHLEASFSKTTQASEYIAVHKPDLLFLDINMPAVSGIDFYGSLAYKPAVIFTTSYSEYALESYELQAIDYLLKPFTFARFEQAVSKAEKYLQVFHDKTRHKELILKADYGTIKIYSKDILFIEGLDNYLKIHLEGKTPVIVRMTLKSLNEALPENFMRIHRSYIVPFDRIESVRNKLVVIGKEEIPVSASYEEQFNKWYNR